MKVVILQPGYIPWLGFFDLMYQSDIFVIFDDVQYTVRDWRSRNRIKTPDGVMWLTVPVKAKGVRDKLIKDVEIDNSQNWKMRHLKSYESFYRKAKYFNEIMTLIRNIYKINYTYLIDLDMDITIGFCEYMSLKSKIIFSSTIDINGKKDERLLAVCQYLNADKYLSGNAAKQYIRVVRIHLTEALIALNVLTFFAPFHDVIENIRQRPQLRPMFTVLHRIGRHAHV